MFRALKRRAATETISLNAIYMEEVTRFVIFITKNLLIPRILNKHHNV